MRQCYCRPLIAGQSFPLLFQSFPVEEKKKNHLVSEHRFGSFQRSFRLPESVDQDKVAGTFEKGVLTVTLPKSAQSRKAQRKIEIRSR